MKSRRLLAAAAVTLPACLGTLVACSGDTKAKPDARPPELPDAGSGGSATCTATAMYAPTFGSADQAATDYPAVAAGSNTQGSPHEIFYGGRLNQDQTPDVLDIELYAQSGTFGSGDIVAKQIQLTGTETSYKDCGACVLILTDMHMQGSGVAETDDYMATGGTLDLTSVSGTLQGTLTNVTLTHVNIDPQTYVTTPVGDCNATITSAAVNVTIKQGSGFLADKQDALFLRHRRY